VTTLAGLLSYLVFFAIIGCQAWAMAVGHSGGHGTGQSEANQAAWGASKPN
jgi:hypothetical protein